MAQIHIGLIFSIKNKEIGLHPISGEHLTNYPYGELLNIPQCKCLIAGDLHM